MSDPGLERELFPWSHDARVTPNVQAKPARSDTEALLLSWVHMADPDLAAGGQPFLGLEDLSVRVGSGAQEAHPRPPPEVLYLLA